MIRSLTVTNYLGDSLTIDLARPEKSGFVINSITGLGPGKATINRTEISTSDGSIYNSSRINERNIVISLKYYYWFNESIETLRQKSYRYFPLKKPVTLLFVTDNRIAKITGRVETNDPDIFSKDEGSSISIICPYPYFYAAGEDGTTVTTMSDVTPEFQYEFSNESLNEKKLLMGTIKHKAEALVRYLGDAETGVIITMRALGTVTNPTLYDLDTAGHIKIDTDKLKTFTGSGLVDGDKITICTIQGRKSVSLLRNGSTSNIIGCLDKTTEWFKLKTGDNIFAYTADSGSENLILQIENETLYEGI